VLFLLGEVGYYLFFIEFGMVLLIGMRLGM